MKIFLSLIIFFYTSLSLSCPDLSGSWKCLDEMNKPSYLDIEKKNIQYKIKQRNSLSGVLEVFADNVPREEKYFMFYAKTITHCSQPNILNIYQEKKVSGQGINSESKSTLDFSLIDQNNFIEKTVTDQITDGQSPQRGEQTYRCSRFN